MNLLNDPIRKDAMKGGSIMDWRTAKLTVPRQRIVSQIGENHDTQATAYSYDLVRARVPKRQLMFWEVERWERRARV